MSPRSIVCFLGLSMALASSSCLSEPKAGHVSSGRTTLTHIDEVLNRLSNGNVTVASVTTSAWALVDLINPQKVDETTVSIDVPSSNWREFLGEVDRLVRIRRVRVARDAGDAYAEVFFNDYPVGVIIYLNKLAKRLNAREIGCDEIRPFGAHGLIICDLRRYAWRPAPGAVRQ